VLGRIAGLWEAALSQGATLGRAPNQILGQIQRLRSVPGPVVLSHHQGSEYRPRHESPTLESSLNTLLSVRGRLCTLYHVVQRAFCPQEEAVSQITWSTGSSGRTHSFAARC
jgi:hypothetical protein